MDISEEMRRELQYVVNAQEADRAVLEKRHGRVWTTKELGDEFTVHSFAAPFVLVTRKADGARGSLMFQHDPRFYWGFDEA